MRIVNGEALVAEAREQIVGGRNALPDHLGDLIGAAMNVDAGAWHGAVDAHLLTHLLVPGDDSSQRRITELTAPALRNELASGPPAARPMGSYSVTAAGA